MMKKTLSLFAFSFILLQSFSQVTQATLQQIQSLLAEKSNRTPAQRKIDSRLLQAVRENRGEKMAADVTLDAAKVDADFAGVLKVDISANITDAFLAELTALGAKIIYASPKYNTVRATISLKSVETIAGYTGVKFVEPAVKSMVVDAGMNKQNTSVSFEDRIARVRKQVSAYLNKMRPLIGSVTSEGDADHRAADVRTTYGYLGQGIKIGVLSDSYNATGGAAANVTSGDLPGTGNPDGYTTPVTVVQDYSGGEDEGRAMLQVIHDLAPAATLYFATADVSEASFATNIQTLRNTYGCNIIIDDVAYFDEPAFQDGITAQAVNAVTAAGALYFSSAGNSGSLAKGTSGVFEGDFNNAGSSPFSGGSKAGTIHNFGTTSSPVNGDIIKSVGQVYNLNWSDPWGACSNDYDLFLVSSTGTVKASSTNVQSGSQNPYEQISAPALKSGDRLIVFKTNAAAVRAFHLNTNRGTLTVATNGQTTGHACAVNAFCMAATPGNVAFSTGYPTGPYPNPFNSSNKVEPFSSDGPRRIFYNPDGTAVTPGNVIFGTNGGTSLSKPDLTAADGVKTTFAASTGLNPFFGTSCAAPHAGAIAALILSGNPSLTTSQVRTILTSSALDVEGSGYDINSGYGIIQAFQAAAQVGGSGPTCAAPKGLASSSVTSSSATVSWSAVTGAASYNLQYKTSAATTWTTVSGLTGTSYNLTGLSAITTYNYQVQTVCSGTSSSAYSTSSSFTTSGSVTVTYCTTKGTTTYEYINKVVLGSISNTSGNNSGYADYTALSTSLVAGSSASIALTPGFTGSSYTEYWTVYIDYNHDGDFTDAGEQVTSGSGKAALTKAFTVSTTATSGATRMRVILHYGSSRTTTCGTFTYGEVEDYTVNITGGAGASFASAKTFIVAPEMVVMPNPAKGNNVKVQLQLAQTMQVTLKITDLSGKILRVDNNLNLSAGKNTYSLNGLNIRPATYIISAAQNNKIIARTKL